MARVPVAFLQNATLQFPSRAPCRELALPSPFSPFHVAAGSFGFRIWTREKDQSFDSSPSSRDRIEGFSESFGCSSREVPSIPDAYIIDVLFKVRIIGIISDFPEGGSSLEGLEETCSGTRNGRVRVEVDMVICSRDMVIDLFVEEGR